MWPCTSEANGCVNAVNGPEDGGSGGGGGQWWWGSRGISQCFLICINSNTTLTLTTRRRRSTVHSLTSLLPLHTRTQTDSSWSHYFGLFPPIILGTVARSESRRPVCAFIYNITPLGQSVCLCVYSSRNGAGSATFHYAPIFFPCIEAENPGKTLSHTIQIASHLSSVYTFSLSTAFVSVFRLPAMKYLGHTSICF